MKAQHKYTIERLSSAAIGVGFIITFGFGFIHIIGGAFGLWGTEHTTAWLTLLGAWLCCLGFIGSGVAD